MRIKLTDADYQAGLNRCVKKEARRKVAERLLEDAPIGTRAPAIMGGSWIKTAHGWKWCTGSTFPRPGGDWTGELVPPEGGAR